MNSVPSPRHTSCPSKANSNRLHAFDVKSRLDSYRQKDRKNARCVGKMLNFRTCSRSNLNYTYTRAEVWGGVGGGAAGQAC